ncbi:serine/threonine-protein kinase [Actinophytocola sp. NPDC049390]|uniref:serine/threonine-protein kinase n=1 Tax=Actinophytocola sp. NPDC049390 TaxID=3363894 RepID=UPI0037A8AD1B
MSTNTVIDHRYRLGPRLGGGGTADVFEARDLRLARRVAVKSCRSAHAPLDLVAEAELLAGLSHPGLLTLFDFGFDGPRPFLVLQLAAGGTLRDRLDSGPMLPDRVAEIGAVIADVLSYVHGEGIVHRDVTPANVLFDDEGECYLADFGVAGSSGDTDANVHGTASYLAPEQVTGGEIEPVVDVYSLGLVLLECLTGEVEFPGDGKEAATARLVHRPKVPGAWGRAWRAVLTAMTDVDPAKRPVAATCATLLRALCTGERVPLAELPARPRSWFGTFASAACNAML